MLHKIDGELMDAHFGQERFILIRNHRRGQSGTEIGVVGIGSRYGERRIV